MAAIAFYTNGIQIPTGSGLGFYGSSGFGTSVSVGAMADTVYITDSNGTTNAGQGNFAKYVHANSGQVTGGVVLALQSIPDYQNCLNIRFTHSSAVILSNSYVYNYDRISQNSLASGLLIYYFNSQHPSVSQVAGGSGISSWRLMNQAGSGLKLSETYTGAAYSPGPSGLTPNVAATQHDYYLGLSPTPSTIGSKTQFGLWFSSDYS